MEIGSGLNTHFWQDSWCSHEPLHREFPQIFALAQDKKALVADCWNWMGEGGTWRVMLRRNLNDWEVDHMAHLLSIIETSNLIREKEDVWLWMLCNTGKFLVKSCMYLFGERGTYDDMWKQVWRLKIPPKVKFFMRLAIRNCLSTIDNLAKRSMCIPSICLLCYQEEETANHVLLHCPFSNEV